MAVEPLPSVKACRKCGQMKSLDSFNARQASKDGKQKACRSCQYDATKKWRNANPEKVAQYNEQFRPYAARYHRANAQRISARKAAYYKQNPEKQTERSRCHRAKALEKHRERSRLWQTENQDRSRANLNAWRAANPEAASAQVNNRRARKASAAGTHTKDEIRALLEAQRFLCANPYCGADLRIAKKTLDHKRALACGGSNGVENLQWLCKSCNSRKNVLSMDVWLERESLRAHARRAA